MRIPILRSSMRALFVSSVAAVALGVPGAYAQTAPVHRPGLGELLGNIFPLIIMVFFIFYFLVTRPQQQHVKALQDLHAALKRGDLVMTSSGIIARVNAIEPDHFVLEIAPGVKVKFDRASVTKKVEKVDPSKSE